MVVNQLLKHSLSLATVLFEGNHSLEHENGSVAMKILAVQLLNTALLVLILKSEREWPPPPPAPPSPWPRLPGKATPHRAPPKPQQTHQTPRG